MYAHLYIFVNIYVCGCIILGVFICIYVYMYIYTYNCKYICIYIDMHIHQVKWTYVCLYPCMDAHGAHAGARVHTHNHIPTRAYTHTKIETYITFFLVSVWHFVWAPSPLHILQIHSLHQVATVTPSHVSLRCRGINIAIFRGSGTNFMVPSECDLAPKCVCGPNFISDFRVDLNPRPSKKKFTIWSRPWRGRDAVGMTRACDRFRPPSAPGQHRQTPTRQSW